MSYKSKHSLWIASLFKELHLDAFVGDAGDDYGNHLSELGVLQNGIEKDFVCVNIFSCEASEHCDVLRTLGTFSIKRVQCKLAWTLPSVRKISNGQFNLQRVVVRVSKDTVLGKSVQGECNEACFDCRAAARFI